MMLVQDVSPAGCRVSGLGVEEFQLGDVLMGELLLPIAGVPVHAKVRSVCSSTAKDRSAGGPKVGDASVGCEFIWKADEQRAALELFLYGSDLQWHFNGLAERVSTPLERMRNRLRRSSRSLGERGRSLAPYDWLPVVYQRPAAEGGNGVGFISAADTQAGERSLVTLDQFSNGAVVNGVEITPTGPRHLEGRLFASESATEMQTPNLHWYRWAA